GAEICHLAVGVDPDFGCGESGPRKAPYHRHRTTDIALSDGYGSARTTPAQSSGDGVGARPIGHEVAVGPEFSITGGETPGWGEIAHHLPRAVSGLDRKGHHVALPYGRSGRLEGESAERARHHPN